ncbi:MAG: hypothetical protein Q9173_005949 [Seirophora scorigena]
MYTEANRGGPFHDVGSLKVDWEKLEVVQRVLAGRLQGSVNEDWSPLPDETKNNEGIWSDVIFRPVNREDDIQFSKLELRVTGVEPAPASAASGLPTEHFLGTEHMIQLLDAVMQPFCVRGAVSPTADGEVRWSLVEVPKGQIDQNPFDDPDMQWKSEGVQIGGPNPARGVMGKFFMWPIDEISCLGAMALRKEKDTFGVN